MTVDTKELQQDIVTAMKQWQKVEDASIASTGQIIEKTENPLIRLVAEIIQRDSQMHHRVQQFIADSIEHKAISVSPDELVQIWKLIEKHIDIEKKTIEMAEKALARLKGQQGMIVQDYLIKYLLEDEQKHNGLLSRLDDIKKGIYKSV
ncbi:MAG: hypothetical protein SVM79_03455 [Chloroflexota bacterium]|nr:hypothetical protein [Chloroflexota bacterium]